LLHLITCAVTLFLISVSDCLGQQKLHGNISDKEKQPIAGASILLHKQGNAAGIAFSVSDAAGDFEILSAEEDSLLLTVSAIGFESQSVKVNTLQSRMAFFLASADVQLPVVVVKNLPVSIHGDTISYNAKAFTQKQDLVVGDILRRIPGMEVLSDGTVKYNGKPIINYYIEGLDLLEDRYGIANNNIPALAIDKIQVLENHQPVRALDSIVFSDRAAINIKLKDSAKLRMFGKAKLSVGASPLLTDIDIAAMMFKKSFQFINTYKQNNIGINNAAELSAHNMQENLNALQNLSIKSDLLSVAKPSPPSMITQRRYLLNDAHTLSLNGLKALKGNMQMRLNLDLINDLQKQSQASEVRYFLPGNSVVSYHETYNGRHRINMLQGSISLFKNIPQSYFKNTLRIQAWQEHESNIQTALSGNIQKLHNPFLSASNEITFLKNKHKKVTAFSSYIGYTNMPQSLSILPGLYPAFFNNGTTYNELSQHAALQTIYTDNYISLKNANRKIIADYKAGFNMQHQSFSSLLQKRSDSLHDYVPDSLRNALKWLKATLYSEGSFTYLRRKVRVTLTIPVSFTAIYWNDKVLQTHETKDYLIIRPGLEMIYKLAPLWSISLNAKKDRYLGDVSNLTSGYMLEDYRTASGSNAGLISTKSYNCNIAVSYRNPLKSRVVTAGVFAKASTSNILYSQTFISGLQIANAVLTKNDQATSGISFRGNQYLSSIKTSVGMGINITSSDKPFLISNKISRFYNKSVALNADISSNPFSFLSADYNCSYAWSSLSSGNKSVASPAANGVLTQAVSLNWFASAKIQATFNIESAQLSNAGSSKMQSVFGDAAVKYKSGKRKIEYGLKIQNIFNAKYYTTSSFNDNSQYTTSLKLRPRRILGSVVFNFR
jgi:hypothetical protein